jgi:uncharacterized integral membrane protein (TIGR00698 family)
VTETAPSLPVQARDALRSHAPGLLVAGAAASAAAFISGHYGAPLMLMALLVGLALNFLSADPRLDKGLGFAARTLLRGGVVLVGARITLGQMADLGPAAILALVVVVGLTLAAGAWLGRRLAGDLSLGVLMGAAVAICGASAALAVAAVLGERRLAKAQLTMTLVAIAVFSALAMVLYPLLAHLLGLGVRQTGFFLGASIHDVAQVMGAGYSVSPEVGDISAVVKLTRVALLAPVLLVLSLLFRAEPGEAKPRVGLPWFVIGFFAVVAVNSMGWLPPPVVEASAASAQALLVLAVAATGVRSPMLEVLKQGPRPLLIAGGATLAALLLSLAAAALLVR